MNTAKCKELPCRCVGECAVGDDFEECRLFELSYPLALTAYARGLKIGMVGEIVLPGTSLHGQSAFIEEISGPGGEILLRHDAGASWLFHTCFRRRKASVMPASG
jgi:hypothetical protein